MNKKEKIKKPTFFKKAKEKFVNLSWTRILVTVAYIAFIVPPTIAVGYDVIANKSSLVDAYRLASVFLLLVILGNFHVLYSMRYAAIAMEDIIESQEEEIKMLKTIIESKVGGVIMDAHTFDAENIFNPKKKKEAKKLSN